MINGIDRFRKAFSNYTDQYVLIGGTACDHVMGKAGLDFRATKDMDIVLIIEAVKQEFFTAFWEFIEKGDYKNREKSDGRKQFYRFTKPRDNSYPYMLELFSGNLEGVALSNDSILTPIPMDDPIISLSAILLDEDYYEFILSHRIMIEGLPFVSEECLIPLKAKAWMDLTERKENGENIKSTDIKKHKNDIVRLCRLLPDDKSINLSANIKRDMLVFIEKYKRSGIIPRDLGIYMSTKILFELLERYYHLSGSS